MIKKKKKITIPHSYDGVMTMAVVGKSVDKYFRRLKFSVSRPLQTDSIA